MDLTQLGLDSLTAIYGRDLILVKALVSAMFITTYRAKSESDREGKKIYANYQREIKKALGNRIE